MMGQGNKEFRFYSNIYLVNGLYKNAIYDLSKGKIFFLKPEVVNLGDDFLYKTRFNVTDKSKRIATFLEKNNFGRIREDNYVSFDQNIFYEPFLYNVIAMFFNKLKDIENNIPVLHKFSNSKILTLYSKKTTLNFLDLSQVIKKLGELKFFNSIELYIPGCKTYQLLSSKPSVPAILSKIVNYSSPANSFHYLENKTELFFTNSKYNPFNFISRSTYKFINPISFHNALSHNLYYYRKLFLWPDRTISYNNIPNSTNKFQNNHAKSKYIENPLSRINKDVILGCKDNPLRYCCLDDRIPFKINSKLYKYDGGCKCT